MSRDSHVSIFDPAFPQPVVTGAGRLFLARGVADGLKYLRGYP